MSLLPMSKTTRTDYMGNRAVCTQQMIQGASKVTLENVNTSNMQDATLPHLSLKLYKVLLVGERAFSSVV